MGTITHRKAWALASGTLGILGVMVFGGSIRVSGGAPASIDTAWHDFTLVPAGSFGDAIATLLSYAGNTIGVIVCGLAAVLFLVVRRLYRDIGTVVMALLLGVLLSQVLKSVIARPRPSDALMQLHDFSYPSGHSMGAAALSVVLVLVLSRWEHRRKNMIIAWSIAAVWTLVMMWSRTALGVHWLSDTVAGAVLGASAASIVWALWGSPQPRRLQSRARQSARMLEHR